MKKTIEQLLPLWGMKSRQVTQIYPSAWEIAPSHVIKLYYDKDQLERNIRISSILADCRIPVAQITHTQTGEQYAATQDAYFLMSEKLPGSNLFDLQDKKAAYEMGRAIARLHLAFVQCEKEMEFWDNSLLAEMKGWIPETLSAHNWPHITESEHARFVHMLEKVSDRLPRQLIHRDVHFGNFLFHEGRLSGYIDFDLTQKNIRIFDLCYFLAGLLAEETEAPLTKEQWLELVHVVITGYESVNRLSDIEIQTVPCVMECIEILFVAYFTGTQDTKHALDACRIFHQLQDYEAALEQTLSAGRLT